MDYASLIRDAFRITWRNKYLWLFGILPSAGLAGGSFSPPTGPANMDPAAAKLLDSALTTFEREARSFVSENLLLVVVVVLLLLALYVLFFLIGVVCRGALVKSVAATHGGERRNFTSTLGAGRACFWRVLGQIFLFALIWTGLLLAIGVPIVFLYIRMAQSVRVLQLIAFFNAMSSAILLVAILFIPVGIVAQFALRELVIGERSVLASVSGGYRLFRHNLGHSLLVWFVQLVLLIGAGIPLAIAAFILAAVLSIPAIILVVAGYASAAIIAGMVAAMILVCILAVAYAILGTFISSYWTLAYLRLRAGVS